MVQPFIWTPFAPLFVITLLTSIFWSSQSSWWGALSRLFQWERRSYGDATTTSFGCSKKCWSITVITKSWSSVAPRAPQGIAGRGTMRKELITMGR